MIMDVIPYSTVSYILTFLIIGEACGTLKKRTCRPPAWIKKPVTLLMFGGNAVCIFLTFTSVSSIMGGVGLACMHFVLAAIMTAVVMAIKICKMGWTLEEFEKEFHKDCNHD